jgi:tetratricopeptide (TPR) repeat protein
MSSIENLIKQSDMLQGDGRPEVAQKLLEKELNRNKSLSQSQLDEIRLELAFIGSQHLGQHLYAARLAQEVIDSADHAAGDQNDLLAEAYRILALAGDIVGPEEKEAYESYVERISSLYSRAVRLARSSDLLFDCLFAQARFLKDVESYDEAIELLDRAFTLADADNKRFYVIFEMGKIEVFSGRYVEAIDHLVEACSIVQSCDSLPRSDSAEALNMLAFAYLKSGNRELGVRKFGESLQVMLDESRPDAMLARRVSHSNLADCSIKSGNYAEALLHFKQALSYARTFTRFKKKYGDTGRSSELSDCLLDLGKYYKAVGDKSKSARYLKKALDEACTPEDREIIQGFISSATP